MPKITVETKFNSEGAPSDPHLFETTGGAWGLKVMCARELIAQGCPQETIELGEPSFIDGQWTIQGTGTKGA